MSAPEKAGSSVSVREFARLDGCDEGLVRRAIKNGKLRVLADGRLDPALAKSGWRRTNRRTGKSADSPADKSADIGKVSAPNVRTAPKRNVRTPKRPGTVEELEEALEELDGEDLTNFLADLVDGKFADTGTAERIKENGLAAKHLIAARKDAGNLIEVDVAESIMFEAARQARDAWQGFPTRIGPLLAADLDIEADRVVEALTVHVQQQLEQLGQPQGSFRRQQ